MSIQPSNVLADGCFDPIHVGHVAYLEAASKLGRLFVNVASDDEIRSKGREPFQSRDERTKTVMALSSVSDTIWHETLSIAIRSLRPAVLAKGRDWIGNLPHDVVVACREVGTVIVYTDTQERTSTERLYRHVGSPFSLNAEYQAALQQMNQSIFAKEDKFYRGDRGDENDAKCSCGIPGCTVRQALR